MKAFLVFFSTIALSSCRQQPIIFEEPQDVTVRQGDDVTLRCVVEHLPSNDLTPVQWTKGGFALGYDRNLSNWIRYSMIGDVSIGEYHLHIKNVDANEDENRYECQVTLKRLRSREATLIVQVPPTGPVIENMDEEKAKVNVVAGKENQILCRSFNGKPAATLHWYRNGIKIVDDVTSVVSKVKNLLYNTTATLRLTPTPADMSATYACVVTSAALKPNEIGRKLMQLRLIEPPTISVSLPRSIKENDFVIVACHAVTDSPVISYRWFVDGTVQPDQHSSVFEIGAVNKTMHSTSIGCEATNKGGATSRRDVIMDVLYSPTFVNGSRKTTAEIGQNITLWCQWDSNPRAAVYWVRLSDDVIMERSPTLKLTEVTQKDSGDYVCRANAGNIGHNQHLSHLTVRGPPMFNSATIQYGKIGEDVTIVCSLSSSPGIKQVKWTWRSKDESFVLFENETKYSADEGIIDDVIGSVKCRGKFIPGDKFASLQVLDVSDEDLHEYQCSVANSYGQRAFTTILKKDPKDEEYAAVLGAIVGGVIGALLFIICIFVVFCCMRLKIQRKSANFCCVGGKDESKPASGGKMCSEDEMIPFNHRQEGGSDGEDNVRSSLSSHSEAPASSLTGSDGTNKHPTSGQDDGYYTEEANSWNRDRAKKSHEASNLVRNSTIDQSLTSSGQLPPPMEVMKTPRALYYSNPVQNYSHIQVHPAYPTKSMSPGHYVYDPPPYDPTALTTPTAAVRSSSALNDRLSPLPVQYKQRHYSDAGLPPSVYSTVPPTTSDYLPVKSRCYTPMHTIAEPVSSPGGTQYVGGYCANPYLANLGGVDRCYQVPLDSSQSSLDRYDRGSILSASAVTGRVIDPYENAARMSNMSRMSQSSRSTDVLRPPFPRMASHV